MENKQNEQKELLDFTNKFNNNSYQEAPTYRDLKNMLSMLDDYQLDMPITVLLQESDEGIPGDFHVVQEDEEDLFDEGVPLIRIQW